MPVPVAVQWDAQVDGAVLALDRGLRVETLGVEARVVESFLRLLARLTGLDLSADADPVSQPEVLRLRVSCENGDCRHPVLRDDESYRLTAGTGTGTGTGIDLAARSPAGVARGLATLLQVVDAEFRATGRWSVPRIVVEDRPRFPWRGLLLDVVRHFMPVASIERTLEAMAVVKLNVLHWHLSDDQGFRVESRAFPRLHRLGSGGQFYRQDEIRGLVRYAADLGIRVVPEFDVPGHATSWLVGYPELGTSPDQRHELASAWGPLDACLDPLNERVYEFLDRFFADVLPLFPDEFVHIGGDEVNGVEWRASAIHQEWLRARGTSDYRELQAHFHLRVRELLVRRGKRVMGWDEIVHPGLPDDVLVQSWRGADALVAAAVRGHECIRSHGYYLDQLWPAMAHYEVDPMQGTDRLSAHGRQKVLGGEACMWTEYVDAGNLDSRIWPRAAAIAERLWAGEHEGLFGRLDAVSDLLGRLGVQHMSVYLARLNELAAGRNVHSLRVLADVLAPLPLEAGRSPRRTDRFTQLNELVDSVPPESSVARDFALSVASLGGDDVLARDRERDRERVQRSLAAWSENHPRFARDLGGTDIYRQLEPHSRALMELARVGIAALDYLSRREPVPQGWLDSVAEKAFGGAVPHADLELRVVEPLRLLVRSAASIAR